MWNRKELKQCGRTTLRVNYWPCATVSLLLLALTGGLAFPRPAQVADELAQLDYHGLTHTEVVNDIVNGLFSQSQVIWTGLDKVAHANSGALASVFNNTTSSGSFLFGLLNALNQLLFQDSIMPGIIIAVGSLLLFTYYFLVENVLQVGEYRFYLENRGYTKTRARTLLFSFRKGCMRKAVLAMFLRAIYTVLWFFTIAGGFIKMYSYRLVPLIAAENPDLSPREIIHLSRRMMAGQKWRCFLLDLSFVGWFLLAGFTFGLFDIIYVRPFFRATNTELYVRLRESAFAEDPSLARYFTDTLLFPATATPTEYPADGALTPGQYVRHVLNADCHHHYTFQSIILLFFAFCFIGYAWEVLYYLVKTGTFINRGTMYGPWLPIYGCGGAGVVVLLRRFADRPALTFFLVMGLCGVIEYFTSWFLEVFKDTKWWDYTGYFLNINGRVCLEGLLVFGIAGTLGIYLIAPALDQQFTRIHKKLRLALCVLLCMAFLLDFCYSFGHPNMAAGVAV